MPFSIDIVDFLHFVFHLIFTVTNVKLKNFYPKEKSLHKNAGTISIRGTTLYFHKRELSKYLTHINVTCYFDFTSEVPVGNSNVFILKDLPADQSSLLKNKISYFAHSMPLSTKNILTSIFFSVNQTNKHILLYIRSVYKALFLFYVKHIFYGSLAYVFIQIIASHFD